MIRTVSEPNSFLFNIISVFHGDEIQKCKLNSLTWEICFSRCPLLLIKLETVHCVKSVQIRSYLWSIFSCIHSKYRKIRTRKSSIFGDFSRSRLLRSSKRPNRLGDIKEALFVEPCLQVLLFAFWRYVAAQW